jgi:NhaP-type Na+/H+ or K+/H+ antiporter
MVALKAVGAAADNIIAIHNVVAASATVRLPGREGQTIRPTIIVLNEHLPGGKTISMTADCTIIMSVISNGLSANWLVSLLASRLKAGPKRQWKQ